MILNNIYVNCGGGLYAYKSKKEAMDFFEDCILASEGSERDRYTEIYFSIKENLNTSKRCFSDGSDWVYTSNIDPDSLNLSEEKLLQKNFDITKEDLHFFKADRYLSSKGHHKLYDVSKYKDIQEIYDNRIKDSLDEKRTYYIMKKECIVCIDDESSNNEYWVEEFSIKDYEYADKWLNEEIEYEDYLKIKNESMKKDIGIFNGEKLYLTVGRYRNNNSLYLGLITDEGESYSDITVNISDKKIKYNIAYLTKDMSKELKDFLREKELISEPILFMKHNLGEYEMVYVDLNKVKEYDPKGYKDSLEQNKNNDIEM